MFRGTRFCEILFLWAVIFSLSFPVTLASAGTEAETAAILNSFQETWGNMSPDVDPGHFAETQRSHGTFTKKATVGQSGFLILAEAKASDKEEDDSEDWLKQEEFQEIADPLEPVNRVFYHFNDKLYFWVLKPVARGYKWLFPEQVRLSVRNFLSNLAMPIRAVNCLLQGKLQGFGREITRFSFNTTGGVLGFFDIAKAANIKAQDEDLGQTLGVYGLGPGIYIHWPLLGPSSARDSVGLVGDAFLDPVYYIVTDNWGRFAVKAYDRVNETSLTIGVYETIKKDALDPYIAVRSSYHQNRNKKIKE